jgi:predicted  nucleic acid-binding Zn-ribbon protein
MGVVEDLFRERDQLRSRVRHLESELAETEREITRLRDERDRALFLTDVGRAS